MTGTLLTTAEVAERLGLSSAAVAQAVRTGALQPTARTNDDFLFTERAVAAFAERRAEVANSPLPPPAAGSRTEWSGDVVRLNSWLKELTDALPLAVASPPAQAPAEPAPPPPAPEPVVEASEPAPPPPAAEPVPAAAELEPERPAPPPIAARSLLERLAATQAAAAQPVAAPAAAEPAPAATQPEPAPVIWPDPVVAAEQGEAEAPPTSAPAPLPAPVAAAEPEAAAPLPTPGSELSRQALLVVQPVVRFRVLRDVTDRLATVPGIADARLERLEGGVASYRVSFAGERPSGEAIGAALASLNLEVMLVDSFL